MSDPMTLPSTAGYGEAAKALVEQYESVSFAEVHREVLHLFPARPAAVVDIGAGSGRDAAALAALGHRVVAVEPTAELRRLGEEIHAGQGVQWLDDALPGLPGLTALRDRDAGFGSGFGAGFDLILLTAVWMHLDEHERGESMRRLAALLAPGGQIVLTLRHGPVPAGRRMFDVSARETIELAARHGLTAVHHSEREDPHARAGVRWSCLGLRRGSAAG